MGNTPNLLNLVCSSTWFVRPDTLEAIVAIANRQDVAPAAIAAAFHYDERKQSEARRSFETGIPMRAVGTRNATLVEGTHGLYRRGSTAVLPVVGAITRYSSLFSSMSGGGAAVESLAMDFQRALDDPAFSSILLSIDSPGGEANGIAEFADQVYAARSVKPVWAYVSDLGASAAYWIGSAAERVMIAETAALGSIGCVAVFKNPASEKDQNLEFVSSVSPNKRPDLTTEAGQETIQQLVNTYGSIFVDAVARNRGVTPDAVVSDFGAGGLKIGKSAVEAGMAEQVSSFESTLAEMAALTEKPQALEPARPTRRAASMSLADKIRAMLDGEGTVDASASVEDIVPNALTPVIPAVTAVTPSDEVSRLRADLAARDAENGRLRLSSYKIAASAWFQSTLVDMKAFPGEENYLIAQYVQAAMDDDRYGPGMDGNLRVSLIQQSVASRTSVKFLTAEALSPHALASITARSTPAVDPNAPMTEERRAELHGASGLGRTILAAEKNGTGR